VLPGVSSRERVLGRTTRENTYWSHVVVFGRRSACDRSRSTRQHPRRQAPRYPWQLACTRSSTRGSTLAAMVLFAHRLCQRVHTGRTPAIAQAGCPATGTVTGPGVLYYWSRTGRHPATVRYGAMLLVAHWPPPATVRYGTVLRVAHWPSPATGRCRLTPLPVAGRASRATSTANGRAALIVQVARMARAGATGIATAEPHPTGQSRPRGLRNHVPDTRKCDWSCVTLCHVQLAIEIQVFIPECLGNRRLPALSVVCLLSALEHTPTACCRG
jgi:hypothetical protein